jgi:hypothetical protein
MESYINSTTLVDAFESVINFGLEDLPEDDIGMTGVM